MKRSAFGFLSFLFLLPFLGSAAQPQNTTSLETKSFLWKVRSKTATAYVLGSLHMMRRESYPLPEKMEKAFDKSDVLAVEANVNDLGRIDVIQLMERAIYPDDAGLEKHVSKETYEAVRQESEILGLPLKLLDRQKPWVLALTFTALKFARLGFDPSYGVDMHFLSKAGGSKKIVELESLQDQIDLLSGFNDDEQELFLMHTLRNLNNIDKDADALLRAWTSGDAKGIEALLTKTDEDDKKMSAINDKLVYKRNRNMASKIEDLLRTRETTFVVVGAGHLVGEKGIIAVLRQKGYSVEQM